jgi:hypothetical protein
VTIDVADRQVRTTLLRAATANVPANELRTALANDSAVPAAASIAARNAWNALGRHRDPASVFDRPQYRAALPYVAASVSDECLTRTVEILGEHSEDPSREQLLEALEEVRTSFSDTTVAVMLASVAYDDVPSSALCAELLADDPRFGLTGLDDASGPAPAPAPPDTQPRDRDATDAPGASPEQRAARRAKKEKVRAERRRQAEVARRADEQIRRRRKQERAGPGPSH